jgi:hypothetical protein
MAAPNADVTGLRIDVHDPKGGMFTTGTAS